MVKIPKTRPLGRVHHGVPATVAVTSGYVLAFRVGGALMALGGPLIVFLFENVKRVSTDS